MDKWEVNSDFNEISPFCTYAFVFTTTTIKYTHKQVSQMLDEKEGQHHHQVLC